MSSSYNALSSFYKAYQKQHGNLFLIAKVPLTCLLFVYLTNVWSKNCDICVMPTLEYGTILLQLLN